MNKTATMAHPLNWGAPAATKPSTEVLVLAQLGNLVSFAKSQGMSLSTFATLTGQALREEIVAPAREGFATEAEGLAELFGAEGGCVDVNVARTLYRQPKAVTRQRIGDLIRDGELIAYRTGSGEYSVPVWQFKPGGGVLPGIREALEQLRTASTFEPITPFTFFLQADPLTDGDTPLEALRAGKLEKVVYAAKHFAE